MLKHKEIHLENNLIQVDCVLSLKESCRQRKFLFYRRPYRPTPDISQSGIECEGGTPGTGGTLPQRNIGVSLTGLSPKYPLRIDTLMAESV